MLGYGKGLWVSYGWVKDMVLWIGDIQYNLKRILKILKLLLRVSVKLNRISVFEFSFKAVATFRAKMIRMILDRVPVFIWTQLKKNGQKIIACTVM